MAGGHVTEASTQVDLGRVVEVLPAEEDHLVLDQGRTDGGDLAVVQRAQVEAEDLGPEGRTEAVDGEHGRALLRGGHDVLLWVGSSRAWSSRKRLSKAMPRIEIVTIPLSTRGVCRFTPALLMR